MACYHSHVAESGDPALWPASGERIHTSAFRRPQSSSGRSRTRTWREARQKLLTGQSRIPSGLKSATNEFGSAVAVATDLQFN